MPYFTSLMSPTEATGYLRAALEDMDSAPGTFSDVLPNEYYDDDILRMEIRDRGAAPLAFWRARSAEPENIAGGAGRTLAVQLHNLSAQLPLTEVDTMRRRKSNASRLVSKIEDYLDLVASSIHNSVVLARTDVLLSGTFSPTQYNYQALEDFGRSPGNTFALTSLWTNTGPGADIDRATDLRHIQQVYRDANGFGVGKFVMTSSVWNTLTAGTQFKIVLGVGTAPMTQAQIREALVANDIAPIEIMDGKFQGNSLLPNDKILVLPPPGVGLGATYWGPTMASADPEFSALGGEAPGAVVGLVKTDGVNSVTTAQSDACLLPALANPDQTYVVTVK